MIWDYIKADSFFRDYMPDLKNYTRKIRGKNGRGNPIEFSKDEKKQIKEAIKKMLKNVTL